MVQIRREVSNSFFFWCFLEHKKFPNLSIYIRCAPSLEEALNEGLQEFLKNEAEHKDPCEINIVSFTWNDVQQIIIIFVFQLTSEGESILVDYTKLYCFSSVSVKNWNQ